MLAAATASLALPTAALAQSSDAFPSKPIRIVVPFAAGGGSDKFARVIAEYLTTSLKQPVSVQNMFGFGSITGTDAVAKAAPDGYTILLAGSASMVIAPLIYKKVPFVPSRDFAPVSVATRFPMVLVVSPVLSSAKTLQEVIQEARRARGHLAYASAGNGTPHHLAMEMMLLKTGVRMAHVPFLGAMQGLKEVTDGHVMAMFAELSSALPLIKSGKVNAIGVASKTRIAQLPNLPTIQEQGVAEFELVGWLGFFAPAAVKPEIVARLNTELVKAMAVPDVASHLAETGFDAASSTPQQLAELVRAETEKWKQVVDAAHISLS